MQLQHETNKPVNGYATRLWKLTDWSASKMIKCLFVSKLKDEELWVKFLQTEHSLDKIIVTTTKKKDAKARKEIRSVAINNTAKEEYIATKKSCNYCKKKERFQNVFYKRKRVKQVREKFPIQTIVAVMKETLAK